MKPVVDIQIAQSDAIGTPSLDMGRRDLLKQSTAAAFAWASLGVVPRPRRWRRNIRRAPSASSFPIRPAGRQMWLLVSSRNISPTSSASSFLSTIAAVPAATIGTDAAARATPDGYTLVMHTISSAVLNKFLYTRVKLEP